MLRCNHRQIPDAAMLTLHAPLDAVVRCAC